MMTRTALMVTNHPGGISTLAWEPVDGRSVGRDMMPRNPSIGAVDSLDTNPSVEDLFFILMRFD